MKKFLTAFFVLIISCSDYLVINEISDDAFEMEPILASNVLVKGFIDYATFDDIVFTNVLNEPINVSFNVKRGCSKVEILIFHNQETIGPFSGCDFMEVRQVEFRDTVRIIILGLEDTKYVLEAHFYH